MNYLAIDIGGTTIQYALMNEAYEMLENYSINTPSVATDDAFYDHLYAHAPKADYTAIGVSVPGTVIDGIIVTKGSERVYPLFKSNIVEKLSELFDKPVTALNDAKAAGLCELFH